MNAWKENQTRLSTGGQNCEALANLIGPEISARHDRGGDLDAAYLQLDRAYDPKEGVR